MISWNGKFPIQKKHRSHIYELETCRNDLIKAGAAEKILSIETSALMVNYFRLLALGNILLLKGRFILVNIESYIFILLEHRDLLDKETLDKALGQIKQFITTETPEGVRSIEGIDRYYIY